MVFMFDALLEESGTLAVQSQSRRGPTRKIDNLGTVRWVR